MPKKFVTVTPEMKNKYRLSNLLFISNSRGVLRRMPGVLQATFPTLL
jgi:hypothetical protein